MYEARQIFTVFFGFNGSSATVVSVNLLEHGFASTDFVRDLSNAFKWQHLIFVVFYHVCIGRQRSIHLVTN